ncbi:MAG: OB-fold domain-containing protein [Burkholderiaceae bacterium]
MAKRVPAAPQAWPETAEFWAAANQKRLLLRRCRSTGRAYHYPRNHSPFNGSDNTEWIEASGEGTIYSFSVMPRADPPYCIAYVTLAEGPTMLTNVLTDNFDRLHIGQSVRVSFEPSEGGQLVPMFVPC